MNKTLFIAFIFLSTINVSAQNIPITSINKNIDSLKTLKADSLLNNYQQIVNIAVENAVEKEYKLITITSWFFAGFTAFLALVAIIVTYQFFQIRKEINEKVHNSIVEKTKYFEYIRKSFYKSSLSTINFLNSFYDVMASIINNNKSDKTVSKSDAYKKMLRKQRNDMKLIRSHALIFSYDVEDVDIGLNNIQGISSTTSISILKDLITFIKENPDHIENCNNLNEIIIKARNILKQIEKNYTT